MAYNYPGQYQQGFREHTGESLNNRFNYLMVPTTLVALGTTQATAAPMLSAIVNVSTGTSNQGTLLPPGPVAVFVNNATGATIKIYPATSAGTIDGGSGGAAVTLTSAHRAAYFYPIGQDKWVSALVGAVSS